MNIEQLRSDVIKNEKLIVNFIKQNLGKRDKNIDSILKLFPKEMASSIKVILNKVDFSKSMVAYNSTLDKLGKRYIKGADFEIYECKADIINMMTAAGGDFSDKRIPPTSLAEFFFIMLKSGSTGEHDKRIKRGALKDLKVSNNNGVVTLENWDLPNRIPILTFSGLNKKLNDKQFISVVLHEIGHHTIAYNRMNTVFVVLSIYILHYLSLFLVSPFIVDPTFFSIMVLLVSLFFWFGIVSYLNNQMQSKEYISDAFSAKAGYGDEHIQALKIIEREIKKQRELEATKNPKILRAILNVLKGIKIIFDKMGLLVKTHPDFDDRIKAIEELSKENNIALSKSTLDSIRKKQDTQYGINLLIFKLIKTEFNDI